MLGDSCHATLPYVGQGANQAIEDSVVLADCLATKPGEEGIGVGEQGFGFVEKALQNYYDRRHKRTKRIVDMAHFMAKAFHPTTEFQAWGAEKLMYAGLKSGVMFRVMEKEIVDDCPVKVPVVDSTVKVWKKNGFFLEKNKFLSKKRMIFCVRVSIQTLYSNLREKESLFYHKNIQNIICSTTKTITKKTDRKGQNPPKKTYKKERKNSPKIKFPFLKYQNKKNKKQKQNKKQKTQKNKKTKKQKKNKKTNKINEKRN